MAATRKSKNTHLVFPTIEAMVADLDEEEIDLEALLDKQTLDVIEWGTEVGQSIVEAEKANVHFRLGESPLPVGTVFLCTDKLPAPALQTLSRLDYLGRPTAHAVLAEYLCDRLADGETTLDTLVQQPWVDHDTSR